MKRTSFNSLLLTGLSAYLLRLELSVDRALRQGIGSLRDYCEGAAKPTLRQVLDKLDSMCVIGGAEGLMQMGSCAPRHGYLRTFIGWFEWHLRGSVAFSVSEVRFIHSALLQLSTELDRHQTVEPEVFGPIRLRLTKAYAICIARIPDKGIRGKISRVEHLNQNFMLKTETIDSICDHRNWLN
jgi:hypothetical protein